MLINMTIRKKTLVIIGSTFIGLVVALFLISQSILLDSFVALEEQDTRRNVSRVLTSLSDDLVSLDTMAADWATWDDTYRFIEGDNAEYIEANLVDGAFTNMRLNFMLFINTSGQFVFGKGFDLHNEKEIPIPESLYEHLADGDIFMLNPDTENNIAGLVQLPEGLLLVASRPILTGKGEGPARGILLFGRYLDESEMNRLAQITLLSLAAYRADDTRMPADFQTARLSISTGADIFVRPLDTQTVAGYTLLTDIHEKPALLLRVELPRDIFQHGQASIFYLILSTVIAGLVFGGVTIFLLETQVLSRLVRLGKSVSNIGTSGNPAQRVSMKGRDEVSSLADTINGMMEMLERSGRTIQEKNGQLMRQQKELKEKTGELVQANQHKSEFLAHMSHEFRTPLNAIIGFSEIMRDGATGKINEEQKQCLNDIFNSGQHLLSLINDLLDMATIESGKMVLSLSDGNLADLIQSIGKEMAPLFAAKGQCLEIDVPDELPLIFADRKRVKQVLLNLLGNASKFTPEGGKLKVEAVGENNGCKISVVDNGIGIMKDEMEMLFQPFSRLESQQRTKESGTGLGLAIVRQIVEMHGGRIWVESEYGKGSRFTFYLPAVPNIYARPRQTFEDNL